MTAVAQSLGALGVADYDGQPKILAYGPAGQEERVGMRWRGDMDGWFSQPRLSVSLRDAWIMRVEGVGSPSATWGYLTMPAGGPGQFGQSSYSWSPRAIRHADAAFAAGLVLQERMVASVWAWNPGAIAKITTVWYPKGPDDQISNLDNPDDSLGIELQAQNDTRRVFKETGWLDSGVQSSARPNLAPHLYATRFVEAYLEYLLAEWRWVGIP